MVEMEGRGTLRNSVLSKLVVELDIKDTLVEQLLNHILADFAAR